MKQRLPWIISITFLFLYFASNYRKQSPSSNIDYDTFGNTPVHLNGRVQPLDSVARNALLGMRYTRTFKGENGKKTPAIVWLTELMMRPDLAHERPGFRIQDEDVRGLLKLPNKRSHRSKVMIAFLGPGNDKFYYTFNEIVPSLKTISEQAQQASELEDAQRSRFQRAVITLARALSNYTGLSQSLHHGQVASFTQELNDLEHFSTEGIEAVNLRQQGAEYDETAFNQMMSIGFLYQGFEQSAKLLTLPQKTEGEELEWNKTSHVLKQVLREGGASETIRSYAAVIDSYRTEDFQAFNENVQKLHADLRAVDPTLISKASVEQQFNFIEPFYIAATGYVMAFLAVIISWARWPQVMNKAAFGLICACAVIHTIGIIFRIYIIGYAPVINLYSSAVFVGWGAVLLAIVLEAIFKNSMGNATAAVIGFATLLVAHHLSVGGDTLEMLRAVLDNNFWLATHVIIITLGYSATFLAGTIGFIFILMSVLSQRVDKKTARTFGSMVYGIVGFATLFSFVGTILGCIWADQSWGRFWGWDPKENGALLIVIWNAIILHCRWGGFVKRRGLMMLAVFGNVICSWSWFGTNMLGIGLHAYGFMDAAFTYLSAYMLAQVAVIGLAAIPTRYWKSSFA
ncbi:MAG: cytochrome c biogenesis protein CcsA [Opitutales bacterium]|nr:cytochrome c biogenesis protein CcsA [Opitutales bacterium]